MNQRHDTAPSQWDWPASDMPVDLTPYDLPDWTEHRGDSPITLALPRKRRGSTAARQPAYLLKKSASAIGERTYYLLARLLDLPNSVVFWADYPEFPVVAIRYEPAATGDRTERLVNPLDEYRHLALYYLLGEDDDTEFMVRDSVLFRIDAASAGDALWSAAILAMGETVSGRASEERWALEARGMVWTADRLRADSPEGYAAYLDTLARLLQHPEWDEVVANDLRTCPAAGTWRMDLTELPMDGLSSAQKALAQAWAETPLMDHLADAHLTRMAHQRAAIRQLLTDTDTL